MKLLQRILPVERSERHQVLLAIGWFATVLFSYGILKPARDELATDGGIAGLWNMTFLGTLIAAPLFAAAASRWPRRTFVPMTYVVVALNLVAFFLAQQKLGTETARTSIGPVFYVWVSIYVMFVVSVLWSVLVDVFTKEQGMRLFGAIAVGGSIGKILGSAAIAAGLAEVVTPSGVLLVAAGTLCGSAWLALRLIRVTESGEQGLTVGGAPGRGVLHAIRAITRSPLLLGVAAYVLLLTFPSSFVYIEKARIIGDALDDPTARMEFYARLELCKDVGTTGVQLFVTAHVMRRLGLTGTLMALPIFTTVGFVAIALGDRGVLPSLAVFFAFDVLLDVGRHALARPSREAVFALMTRDQKYASKNFIDTSVYRGGDVVSAYGHERGLHGLAPTLSGVALWAVPITLIWSGLAFRLGRRARTEAP